jgi:hypothetical protein
LRVVAVVGLVLMAVEVVALVVYKPHRDLQLHLVAQLLLLWVQEQLVSSAAGHVETMVLILVFQLLPLLAVVAVVVILPDKTLV